MPRDLAEIERIYREMLGPFPERVPLNLETVEEVDCGEYTRLLLKWDNDASERVEGYVLKPKAPAGPMPAIVAFHSHNQWKQGKRRTAGVEDPNGDANGPELARRGFVVICGDAPGWDARKDPNAEPKDMFYERVVAMKLLAQGRCVANQYIWDAMREIDVLETLDFVDKTRIGATGVSMGSGHTWLSAMLEPRIKALVAVSSFYTYKALYEPPIIHCYMNYLPRVLVHGIETYDLFGLIAPRPFLMINGSTCEQDPLEATKELYEKAQSHWEKQDAGERFKLTIHEGGHGYTPETREEAYAWFRRWLG